jgi:hypothetical protein
MRTHSRGDTSDTLTSCRDPASPAEPEVARAGRQALAELLDASRSADPEVRRTAVRELCPCEVKTNDPDVWDRILEMRNDPDPKLRRNVRKTLARHRRTGKVNIAAD